MLDKENKTNNIGELTDSRDDAMQYDLLAFYTSLLSVLEVGLGSILHGLRIPFSGQFLSLNQIFILSILSIQYKVKNSPAIISTCSALLKSLAPAGKKLTPMLAISAQGHLFSLGLYAFGNNLFGRCVGGVLAGLWAFVQPLSLYLLIFGRDLIDVYKYFFDKFSQAFSLNEKTFIGVLLIVIIIKIVLSFLVVIIAHSISKKQIESYFKWVFKYKRQKISQCTKSPLKGAIKDTFNPFFIFTFCLTCIFFIFARSEFSLSIWVILRPLTVGFIVFYFLRRYPIKNKLESMQEGPYKEILIRVYNKIKK